MILFGHRQAPVPHLSLEGYSPLPICLFCDSEQSPVLQQTQSSGPQLVEDSPWVLKVCYFLPQAAGETMGLTHVCLQLLRHWGLKPWRGPAPFPWRKWPSSLSNSRWELPSSSSSCRPPLPGLPWLSPPLHQPWQPQQQPQGAWRRDTFSQVPGRASWLAGTSDVHRI